MTSLIAGIEERAGRRRKSSSLEANNAASDSQKTVLPDLKIIMCTRKGKRVIFILRTSLCICVKIEHFGGIQINFDLWLRAVDYNPVVGRKNIRGLLCHFEKNICRVDFEIHLTVLLTCHNEIKLDLVFN